MTHASSERPGGGGFVAFGARGGGAKKTPHQGPSKRFRNCNNKRHEGGERHPTNANLQRLLRVGTSALELHHLAS